MYLVLCSASDASGLWAYEGLQHLGLAPVQLVLSEWLTQDTQWDHRIDRSGAHIKIVLPDGKPICGSRVRGAINRLYGPSPAITQHAVDSDREYAQAELQAFYLSWLNALPGAMINRPTPMGLSGPRYHASEWALRAGRAGLAVERYRQSAHDAPDKFYRPQAPEGRVPQTFIAFGGQVFGGEVHGLELPSLVSQACAKLAIEAHIQMLGIDLYRDADGCWNFAGASPQPDLHLGGMPLLQRIAQHLQEGGRA